MPVTGLRAESMNNLVLNEGAFLVGFDYSQYNTAAALESALADALQNPANLLGATNGGGTFVCTPETRQIEIDGIRGSVKGATHVDAWTVKLTGTLKELKKATFSKLLMCADEDSSIENMTVLTVHSDIESSDYIPYLCWVGSTPYGYMLIGMTDVLNTVGMTMTFQDKNEATVPFEFTSHSNSLTGDAVLPVKVILLTSAENAPSLGSITVTSAAGATSGKTSITISDYTPGSGESYVYKTAQSNAPSIDYGEIPDYSWTAWDGSADIVATTGHKIAIVSINGSHEAVAYGSAQVTAKS